MSVDAILLAAGLAAVLTAVIWLGLTLKGELRALGARLDRRETAGAGPDAAAAKANPRLTAARHAAASRAANRLGRTTVKRI